jgi:hypothetical protein
MNLIEAVQNTLIDISGYKEAVNPEFAATFEGVDSDEHLYRSLTGNPKDFSPYKHDRLLKIVYYQWLTHPLAKRMIELIKDFIIGRGIEFKAENPKIQSLLWEHWNDPVNNWPIKQHKKIRELLLYGEQAYSISSNDANGLVRLGYIDPAAIKEIVTAKDNIEFVEAIKLKGKSGEDGKVYDVVGWSDKNNRLIGEAFFFAINNVSNAVRGNSVLLDVVDWLDVFDKSLFDEADRVELMKRFVWDITLEGMTEDQIKDWVKDQKPPKSGSIRAHNENVTWSAVTPDLKTQDTTNFLKFVMSFVIGGKGIPEHYYGINYQINKATATEMSPPFEKLIENNQLYVRWMISQIFDFVIAEAIDKKRKITDIDTKKALGTISENDDQAYEIILPEPSTRDIQKLSTSLVQLGQGLTIATNNGWLSKDTAGSIYSMVVSELGHPVDYENEKEKAEEEQDKEIENDFERYTKNINKKPEDIEQDVE